MKKVVHTSIELIAEDGMLLTDGEHYAKAILLPYENEGDEWREIPESERPIEIEKEEVEEI